MMLLFGAKCLEKFQFCQNAWWFRQRLCQFDSIGCCWQYLSCRILHGNKEVILIPQAPYPLTSTGVNPDCYVSKLDNNGNFAWVVAFNGTGDDGINSIHLNSSGGLYSTGYFSGNLDFDPGVGTANIVGNNDFFVHKLNLPCLSPTVPTLAAGSNVICAGSSTTLSISAGTLNSATNWHWYTSTWWRYTDWHRTLYQRYTNSKCHILCGQEKEDV